MDDSLLVQRASAGEVEAFEELYDRYSGRVHDTLWWVLADRSAADDALERTFLTVGSRIHQAPVGPDLFVWIMAVARYEALGRRGGRRTRSPGPSGGEAGAAVGPADEGEVSDQLMADAAALLTPTERLAFDLGFRQALGPAEVAAVLGTSVEGARTQVQRARQSAAEAVGLATLTAQGSGFCTGLTMIVPTVDARLAPALARKLSRHVGECARCQSVVSSADPEVLLLRAPAFARPPDVRAEVIASVVLAGHDGSPWPARTGGFPPGGANPRPIVLAGVGAAGALGLLLMVAFLIDSPNTTDTRVSAGSATSTSTSTSTTTTTRPGETTTTAGEEPTDTTAQAPAAGGGPAPTAPPSPGTTAHTHPSTTTSSTTTTTTTTQPPDEQGPVLSGLTVSPTTIDCNNPAPVTITVTAVDERSGVGKVTAALVPFGNASGAMSHSGGNNYTVVLTPTNLSVAESTGVLVTAQDTLGNEANPISAPNTITVNCPSPEPTTPSS